MTRIGWCPGGREVAEMTRLYPDSTAVRLFYGFRDPIPTVWAGEDLGPLAPEVLPILSFKVWDLPAMLRLADVAPPGTVLTYHHEDEQQDGGDIPPALFVSRWVELARAFATHPRRGLLRLVPIYTRYWWEKNPGDLRYWPAEVAHLLDAVGWDVYNSGTTYRTPDDLLAVPREMAARTGLPYLLAELGAVRIAGDLDGAGRQAWMRAMVDAARADGALTVCWFHKDEWDLAPYAAEQQTWRELTEQENTGMIVSGIPFVAGRNDYTDRDGTKYGIAIHNTSNTAAASAEASYATRRTDGISSHFYADGSGVIQSIDTKYRAGHAGSTEGNENAVAVEITGTNDKPREWWIANVAWDELGRVLAAVCRKYGIEPRRATVAEMQRNPRVRAFYAHDDMRRAWGGTTHTDPGPNFPWDHLFAAVKSQLAPAPAPTPQEDTMSVADVRTGLAEMFDEASNRSTPTGRNLANDLYAIVRAAMAGVDLTDEAGVAAAVLAGLSPEKIAAAIPPEIAKQVADELAARLSS